MSKKNDYIYIHKQKQYYVFTNDGNIVFVIYIRLFPTDGNLLRKDVYSSNFILRILLVSLS